MSTNQSTWVPLYKEMASVLLGYKEKRRELVEIIKTVYQQIGINLPTLERQEEPIVDIDPFTIFGFFNKSSQKPENRIKILSELCHRLGITASIPTVFEGIPVLNNQNATYYSFPEGRGNHDIDDLWDLFERALLYAKSMSDDNLKRVSSSFDLVIQKKGNGNSKVTMALYWIAPESFINLDNRNIWFIYESGDLPESLVKTLPAIGPKVSASVYFEVIAKLHSFLIRGQTKLKDFIDLSFEAWTRSEKVISLAKEKKNDSAGTAMVDGDVVSTHYWLYTPGTNACMWSEFYEQGIMGIDWDLGNYTSFKSKGEMKQYMKDHFDPSNLYTNAAHATWQFANEMKIGDIVFVKKGLHQIIGCGTVESDYIYDPSRSDGYPNIRKMKWTHKGEWSHPRQAAVKTLTDITPYYEYVQQLKDLVRSENTDDEPDEKAEDYPSYTEDDFLTDVFMDKTRYQTLTSLIGHKMNVILQGAPGVGKTWVAKRLAYSMMGVKDQSRVMVVQFHQSYSYEDFIMGIRPSEKGFELSKGAFYTFCKAAEIDSEDNLYFFIIDEINRGNLSKIFGELFMLIESDKRGVELKLLYSDEKFSVPKNVRIIGTMNTADRSLAMLDYALRRRFAFFELEPAFQNSSFQQYEKGLNSPKFDSLIRCVENLNTVIEKDESLGKGFCIGHSYFCNFESIDEQRLSEIVEYELIPLLSEYWFDEPSKVKDWSIALRASIQ